MVTNDVFWKIYHVFCSRSDILTAKAGMLFILHKNVSIFFQVRGSDFDEFCAILQKIGGIEKTVPFSLDRKGSRVYCVIRYFRRDRK